MSIRQIAGEEHHIQANEIKRSTFDSFDNIEVYKVQLESLRSANSLLEKQYENLMKQFSSLQMTNQNLMNDKLSGNSQYSNISREKEMYLKRLEDQEDEYQRIHLVNSELKHKLSVSEDLIYNIQSNLEESNKAKCDLEVALANLKNQLSVFEHIEKDWRHGELDQANKMSKLCAEFEVKMEQKDQDFNRLSDQCQQLMGQIDRLEQKIGFLQNGLGEKDQFISQLKKEIDSLKSQLSEANEFKSMTLSDMEKLKAKDGSKSEDIFKFEQEILLLNTKIAGLESDKHEMEQDMLKLIQEIEKISKELRSRQNGDTDFIFKIEELQLRLTTETNHFADRLKDLEGQLMFKEELIKNSNEKLFEERKLKEESESKLNSLNNQNEILTQQNQRIKDDLLNCETKLNEARNTIQKLESAFDKDRQTRASHQVNNSTSRIDELLKEIQGLKAKMEIETIQNNSSTQAKNLEINSLKTKNQDLEDSNNQLAKKITQLELKLVSQKAEISKIDNLYQSTMVSFTEAENQLSDITRTNNILMIQLAESDKTIKQLKNLINNELMLKIEQLQSESDLKDNSLHQLEIQLKAFDSEKKNLKIQLQDQTIKTEVSENDYETIKKLMIQHESENRELKLHVRPLNIP